MRVVIKEDGKYLVKDIQDYDLKKYIESNIIGRKYNFGYSAPFTAFAPIAKYEDFTIGLKTYPNTLSTPFYTQGLFFEGPFMLHMVEDHIQKIQQFIDIAKSWNDRKKEYDGIDIGFDDVTNEGISESAIMFMLPSKFLRFDNNYFTKLSDFEMFITPLTNKIKTSQKIVEKYAYEINNFIYSFTAKEFLSVEKPICGIPDVSFDFTPANIEIPVGPGTIFSYIDTIDMGPRKAYRVFRIEPKVFGALDFEIFLLKFRENHRNIASSIKKLVDICGIKNKEKFQEALTSFMSYYLELSSVTKENDEIGAIEESAKLIESKNAFITISESGISIWSKIDDCYKSKREIEDIEDSLSLDFIL